MNYTNREVVRRLKQYDMFLNSLNLTTDEVGTGTIAAGIAAGLGRLNNGYDGVARGAELVVVKLKSYTGVYKEDTINSY